MKFVEFTYTKADGSQSKRAIIELVTPTKHIEGIDVTSLSQDDFADFCREFSALKAEQHTQTMEKLAQFDLKHNYRKFIPEQMADITTDYV
jgi:hypothetical protein